MAESVMLMRLKRDTGPYHVNADNDRLTMLKASADAATYGRFLARVFGFEAAVEAFFARTEGLGDVVDLRARMHIRLLRADLAALGIIDPSALPRWSIPFPFRYPVEALGWMYVVERNTLLHATIDHHLRSRMPEQLKLAGSYLSGQVKTTGVRLRELGVAMDTVVKSRELADRCVAAARFAFRYQHGWYDIGSPLRQRVA
jgi:heme oxygenase